SMANDGAGARAKESAAGHALLGRRHRGAAAGEQGRQDANREGPYLNHGSGSWGQAATATNEPGRPAVAMKDDPIPGRPTGRTGRRLCVNAAVRSSAIHAHGWHPVGFEKLLFYPRLSARRVADMRAQTPNDGVIDMYDQLGRRSAALVLMGLLTLF